MAPGRNSNLLVDQGPTARILALWTLRPDSSLPWTGRSHLTQVTLHRLPHLQATEQYHHLAFHYSMDLEVWCLSYVAWPLWQLGYPDQALRRNSEAVTLAQGLSHPLSLAAALDYAAMLHYSRREGQAAQERAEAGMALASEKGFPQFLAIGMVMRGWALAVQGQGEEGIAQILQGLTAFRAAGAEVGQTEAGLTVLAEALAMVDKIRERYWEAELHRLKGELLLRRASPTEEVAAWFRQALAVAQHQQAKSLELRAAMSLTRLWERQGKRAAAHALLAPIYGWFTEGFDTTDL